MNKPTPSQTPEEQQLPGISTSSDLGGTEAYPGPGSAGAAPSLPPDTSRYRPVRFHARGGLGEVFVAADEELGREVALKRIQQRHADDPASRRRFLREAEITARLEHPGVVPVHGLVQGADGQPCYAMRFIEGETLHEAISRHHQLDRAGVETGERRLELRQLLARFLAVCETLAYAHSRGIIHRDLKPANIMLGKYGETLVVDWGLAKPVGADETPPVDATEQARSAGAEDETRAGQAMGTPAYMSPEQAAGRPDQHGPASDVYSLGATLYSILTGQPPFQDRDRLIVMQKVQAGDFPRPRQVSRQVPAALEAVCLKAMSVRQEDRYGSPRALAEDVERWLADEPFAAYREPWTQRLARWARRHRTAVTAGGVALALLVAGAVGGMLLWESAEQRRREQARTHRTQTQSSAEADEKLAVAEVQVGRFASAEQILKQTVERLQDEPELAELHDRLEARRDRVERLVRFHRLADQVEGWAFQNRYVESRAAAEEGLAALDIFRHHDWRNHLPDAELTAEQRKQLRHDAYRLLLMGGGLRAMDGLTRPATAEAAFNAGLEALERAEQVGPSRAASLLKLFCRFGLKQWDRLEAPPAGEPAAGDDVDYYLMGLLHLALKGQSGHPVVQRLLAGLKAVIRGVDFQTPEATAERYLRKAIEIDPRHYFHHLFLAQALRFAGYPQGSELAANACVALRPAQAHGYHVRASALRDQFLACKEPVQKRQCIDRALDDCNKALRFDPSPAGFNNRGVMHSECGELDRAIADFTEALRLQPGDEHFHRNRAETCTVKGDVDRATADYAFLMERRPKDTELRLDRARLYGDHRQWARAAADVGKAIELEPQNPIHRGLHAGLLVRAGDLGQYRKACADMLVRFGQPNDSAATASHVVLACTLAPLPAADTAKVLALAQRHLAGSATDWHHTALAAVCYRNGEHEKAITSLHRSLQLAPASHVPSFRPHSAMNWPLLALAYHRRGDNEKALVWYDQAVMWYARKRAERPEGELPEELFSWPNNAWWDGVAFECLLHEAEEVLASLERPAASVHAVAFSPDGKTLAAGAGGWSRSGELQLWDPVAGTLRMRRREPLGIQTLAFTPDGKTLVTTDFVSRIARLRDAATGKVRGVLPGYRYKHVCGVAVSPDGKLAATAGNDEVIRLWTLDAGKELRTLHGHTGVYRVAFSPDSKTLASVGRDRTARLWDVSTGQEKRLLRGHEKVVEALALSPDGSLLATASQDKTVKLWRTTDGKELATLKGHQWSVLAVTFSPDGKLLASGAGSWFPVGTPTHFNELKLWDVAGRQELANLQGHTEPVVSVAFSPDGKTLASAGADKLVKLWDVAGRKEWKTLRSPQRDK